jgi:hypothetical protein
VKTLNLTQIHYFEVLEIDNFEKYKNRIISRFSSKQAFFSAGTKNDLKRSLSEVKNNLDVTSRGGLFTINFSKLNSKNSDLINSVQSYYIKTTESYFIIQIAVYPSKKFFDLYTNIMNQKDTGLSLPHFNSMVTILKTGKWHSHQTMLMSLKIHNLNNLLSELNEQVRINITKYFKGFFHGNKINSKLPSIQYFETNNISLLQSKKGLYSYFYPNIRGHYSLEDKQVEIFLFNHKEDETIIRVLKQKGHGTRQKDSHDLTNYDNLETYDLLRSLAFPCAFDANLLEQNKKLNKLKRDIYDFVKYSENTNALKGIFLLTHNQKYLKLKQTLTQVILNTKRFETEFTKNSIYFLTNEFRLDSFKPQFDSGVSKNLLAYIINNFMERIKDLESRIKSTNEVFKSMEELNAYRTNLLLQGASLFIALLAFIFAFDKVKAILQYFYQFIFHN